MANTKAKNRYNNKDKMKNDLAEYLFEICAICDFLNDCHKDGDWDPMEVLEIAKTQYDKLAEQQIKQEFPNVWLQDYFSVEGTQKQ